MKTAHPRNRRSTSPFLATALALAAALAASTAPAAAQGVACVAGFAGPYPCDNVDLLAIVPSWAFANSLCNLPTPPPDPDLGAVMTGSDMWGWTDEGSGREFAVQGLSDAVAFIEVTEPTEPVFLGCLPAPVLNFLWRDLKVYDDKAYIVGDFSPSLPDNPGTGGPNVHGLQIFDLTQLLTADPEVPTVFAHEAVYDGFDEAHNFVIDEETGFAAAVASGTCNNEWHLLDLNKDPSDPDFFVGCFDSGVPGSTHEGHCAIYHGPDVEHQGKQICLAFNEDRFAIIDMSDLSGPKTQLTGPKVLAARDHEGRAYVHQGWFTEDHAYVASNDELDEVMSAAAAAPHNTHTYIWDVRDLDDPVHIATYAGPTAAIDHNHYFNGRFLHQANYTAGYRVLDGADIADGVLTEVAFFDTHPPNADVPAFAGLWSGYFFFESGAVAVSQIDNGELFVLRPHLPDDGDPDPEAGDKATGGGWLAAQDGGKIHFGFNAKQKPKGPHGSLQLNDKGAGVKIHLDEVTLIRSVEGVCGTIVAGESALEFRGTGRFGKDASASFRVCVVDNGEPGNSGSTPTPDRFHLECVAGCAYSTADRAQDDGLDGGNLQVHRGSDEPAGGSATAATLILDPLLLDEGAVGAVQLFTVRAYDGDQEPLAGAGVTLLRTAGTGTPESFSAVTDLTGTALFSVAHPARAAEYRAVAGNTESNGVEVEPLLP